MYHWAATYPVGWSNWCGYTYQAVCTCGFRSASSPNLIQVNGYVETHIGQVRSGRIW